MKNLIQNQGLTFHDALILVLHLLTISWKRLHCSWVPVGLSVMVPDYEQEVWIPNLVLASYLRLKSKFEKKSIRHDGCQYVSRCCTQKWTWEIHYFSYSCLIYIVSLFRSASYQRHFTCAKLFSVVMRNRHPNQDQLPGEVGIQATCWCIYFHFCFYASSWWHTNFYQSTADCTVQYNKLSAQRLFYWMCLSTSAKLVN